MERYNSKIGILKHIFENPSPNTLETNLAMHLLDELSSVSKKRISRFESSYRGPLADMPSHESLVVYSLLATLNYTEPNPTPNPLPTPIVPAKKTHNQTTILSTHLVYSSRKRPHVDW